jgi:hypothetical protein
MVHGDVLSALSVKWVPIRRQNSARLQESIHLRHVSFTGMWCASLMASLQPVLLTLMASSVSGQAAWQGGVLSQPVQSGRPVRSHMELNNGQCIPASEALSSQHGKRRLPWACLRVLAVQIYMQENRIQKLFCRFSSTQSVIVEMTLRT